jgi:hypothetical protein
MGATSLAGKNDAPLTLWWTEHDGSMMLALI